MKPPTAMLMPLSTWDIASSMGTTLFLGTFRSFARERCRGPGLRSGAARARQSPGYTLLTEEYNSTRAPRPHPVIRMEQEVRRRWPLRHAVTAAAEWTRP